MLYRSSWLHFFIKPSVSFLVLGPTDVLHYLISHQLNLSWPQQKWLLVFLPILPPLSFPSFISPLIPPMVQGQTHAHYLAHRTHWLDDWLWHNFKLPLRSTICQQIMTAPMSVILHFLAAKLQTAGLLSSTHTIKIRSKEWEGGKIFSSRTMEPNGPLPLPTLFGQVIQTAS